MRCAMCCILVLAATAAHGQAIHLKKLDARAPAGKVEIRGVSAARFDPELWKSRVPHLVPDIRRPLLEPRPGKFRNIYAPSVVALDKGYRIFYGGWDGADTGNDRIYCAETDDFLTFTDRRTVIEHGTFRHVCNVNATLTPRGIAMMCTAFPDGQGKNKPSIFFEQPCTASPANLITMTGYTNFEAADINGCSVLVHDAGKYRLYFNNFSEFGKTLCASSEDGLHFKFEGQVSEGRAIVNDVKLFRIGGETWHLMGFHHNGDSLMYALSRDPMKFPAPRPLLEHLDDADRYIVAAGFVVSGSQQDASRKLIGVLYGAGAKPSLDANRIFARWFQKRLVWVNEQGKRVEAFGALGPDAAVFEATGAGKFELYADDGKTLIGGSDPIRIDAGDLLELAAD